MTQKIEILDLPDYSDLFYEIERELKGIRIALENILEKMK